MCVFFSCLVTRQGEVRFCEDDSHETIISRLGLDDMRPLATRGWIRIERPYVDRTWQDVRVDETSAPSWWDAEMVERVIAVSERVAPAWQIYDATYAQAQQIYDATCAQALQAYDATCAQARQAYGAAYAPAWQVYNATCVQAQQAYNASRAQALQVYNAAISTIEGYVPKVPA